MGIPTLTLTLHLTLVPKDADLHAASPAPEPPLHPTSVQECVRRQTVRGAPAATRRATSGFHSLPRPGPSCLGATLQDLPGTSKADANPATLVSAMRHLPPKQVVYQSSLVSSLPEILIVGDSVIRYLTLPGSITYCLSGGKVVDLIELIPFCSCAALLCLALFQLLPNTLNVFPSLQSPPLVKKLLFCCRIGLHLKL